MNDKIDISSDNKSDEITSIKNMVRNLSFRLKGYVWDAEQDKMINRGEPLASSKIINVASSLLQAFSENANLITSKDKLVFYRQKWEINSTFNRFLAKEIKENTNNYEVIMKSFKSTLQNIGDIILNSKDVMKGYLGVEQEIQNNELI